MQSAAKDAIDYTLTLAFPAGPDRAKRFSPLWAEIIAAVLIELFRRQCGDKSSTKLHRLADEVQNPYPWSYWFRPDPRKVLARIVRAEVLARGLPFSPGEVAGLTGAILKAATDVGADGVEKVRLALE